MGKGNFLVVFGEIEGGLERGWHEVFYTYDMKKIEIIWAIDQLH